MRKNRKERGGVEEAGRRGGIMRDLQLYSVYFFLSIGILVVFIFIFCIFLIKKGAQLHIYLLLE